MRLDEIRTDENPAVYELNLFELTEGADEDLLRQLVYDGHRLMAGSADLDKLLENKLLRKLFDTAARETSGTWRYSQSAVSYKAIVFSPHDKKIYVVCDYRLARLANVSRPRSQHNILTNVSRPRSQHNILVVIKPEGEPGMYMQAEHYPVHPDDIDLRLVYRPKYSVFVYPPH